ncbi:MAG: hypothetical protein ABSH22_05380 [Tepidisphaeraceae bacterium]
MSERFGRNLCHKRLNIVGIDGHELAAIYFVERLLGQTTYRSKIQFVLVFTMLDTSGTDANNVAGAVLEFITSHHFIAFCLTIFLIEPILILETQPQGCFRVA